MLQSVAHVTRICNEDSNWIVSHHVRTVLVISLDGQISVFANSCLVGGDDDENVRN